MRLRLMATYRGVPYQAGLGPGGGEATLFSPGPPGDELGFTAAAGHWRKQVSVTDLDALWQSRLVGEYRGEPCLVLGRGVPRSETRLPSCWAQAIGSIQKIQTGLPPSNEAAAGATSTDERPRGWSGAAAPDRETTTWPLGASRQDRPCA